MTRHPRAWLLALSILLFFPFLGQRDLWNPDEPRYAEVTREMLENGQFLVPHLNGTIYTHKPPGMFWAMAASSLVTGGMNETAARLPSALAALGTVLLVFGIGRRLFDPASGFWAALVIATTSKVVWQARVGQIDMLLTFFVTLTAYLWIRAFLEERPALYLAGFGVAGLGTVTKGPVALLPILLSFVVFFLVTKQRSEIGQMRIPRGLLLWAAVVLAWLLPAGLSANGPTDEGGNYLHELVFTQNVTRYTAGADYGGTEGHIHPWYYYLLALPVEFLPWSILLPAAWLALRRREDDPTNVYLPASWVLTTLVFFSLSPAKRSVYLLQLYPALALLVGAGLVAFARTQRGSRLGWSVPAWALAGLTAVLSVALAVLGPQRPEAALLPSWLPYGLSAAFGLMALGSAAAGLYLHKRRPLLGGGSLAVGFGLSILLVLVGLLPVLGPMKSVRPMAERYRALAGDEPYAIYPHVEPSLYFYTQRFAQILRTEAELRSYLARPERVWLFVEKDDLARLKTPVPAIEIAQGADPDNGYVLFVNQPLDDPASADGPAADASSPQSEAVLRVHLDGVDKAVELVQVEDGALRFVLRPSNGDAAILLTPDEFAERIHQESAGRSWWQRLFNISSAAGFLWVACGFLGQALFTGRMLVQWLASERERRSVVPIAFWWLSLIGASMLLVYFIWRRDIVGVLGQVTGWAIYIRNLLLLYRERRELASAEGVPNDLVAPVPTTVATES